MTLFNKALHFIVMFILATLFGIGLALPLYFLGGVIGSTYAIAVAVIIFASAIALHFTTWVGHQ